MRKTTDMQIARVTDGAVPTGPSPWHSAVRRVAAVAAPWVVTAATAAGLVVVTGCGGGGGGGGGGAPATVSGRVLELNVGNGATVLAGANVSINGASAVTAADGTWTIQSAPSNATQIKVTASSVQPLTQPLPKLKPGAANAIGDLFVLPSSDTTDSYTATVTSEVIRADNAAPIPGALVELCGQTTTTDANGNFSVSGLPSGMDSSDGIVGQVTATGFANKPIVLDLPLAPTTPGKPNSGINPIPHIEMVPNASSTPPGFPTDIGGTVTLQSDSGGEGATVTLIDSNNNTVGTFDTTGATGTYGFFVVAGKYTIQVSAAGYTTQSKGVTVTLPNQPVGVNFTLVPGS